ncbi:MAG: hypothetical protein M1831_000805 [Alyxoria varia]|nr:MAG: hypothetical protein M1831_000805 [Alyxoria varia]
MPGIQRLLQGLSFHLSSLRRSSSNDTANAKTTATNGAAPADTAEKTSEVPGQTLSKDTTNGVAKPAAQSWPEKIEPEVPPFPFSKYEVDEAEEGQRLQKAEQDVLLVHGPGQEYVLRRGYSIPNPATEDELLVKVVTIGLNPIDWKGPKYNFGLPSLPWINGRDLTGVVIKTSTRSRTSRIQRGDLIICPSTDYRDIRKAAFQEYVVALEHTTARVPRSLPVENSAGVGVAFVAAAMSLGVCLGVDFSHAGVELGLGEDYEVLGDKGTRPASPSKSKGLDLFKMFREEVDTNQVPEDVRDECLELVTAEERPRPGDWIAIWGASSATGFLTIQLAKKLAGLRTLCIADSARHGAALLETGCADLVVDRLPSAERAAEVVRGVTGGNLRFAIDTVGRESATLLQGAMACPEDVTSPAANGDGGGEGAAKGEGEVNGRANGTEPNDHPLFMRSPSQPLISTNSTAALLKRSHIVGLTGLPKHAPPGIVQHKVPIKAFHAVPKVGEALMTWLERLLLNGTIVLPDTEVAEGGLGGVNEALESLSKGELGARRLVVPLVKGV